MKSPHLHTIKEIAQQLDCGCDCFLNIKTNEIVAIPNFGSMIDEDEFHKTFGAELEKINQNKSHYIKFEVLKSFESFNIMERFVAQLSVKNLQSKLENALANKKPFQNFKHLIDNSECRQSWFDFKQHELEKRVETQLKQGKQAQNNS